MKNNHIKLCNFYYLYRKKQTDKHSSVNNISVFYYLFIDAFFPGSVPGWIPDMRRQMVSPIV